MEEVRLLTAPEIKEYLEIAANAFPMIKMNTPEESEKFYQGIVKSME